MGAELFETGKGASLQKARPNAGSGQGRLAAMFALCLAVSCSLPEQGPSTRDLTELDGDEGYELVVLTPQIAERLAARPLDGFSNALLQAPLVTSDSRLGIGDQITVTIFEAGQGGLFSTQDGKVTFPDMVINPGGFITLPYAGRINALGLAPEEIEVEIVSLLQGKAIEPQAKVSVTRDANNTVTVIGEAVRPASVQLSPRGDRLAEALVQVGGSKFPAQETYISLTRGGSTSTASLLRVLNEPGQNVALRAGDLITLVRRQSSYTIMGSVNRPQDVPFNEPKLTLFEAIGQSSGLLDGRADPKGVFLFRRETAQVLLSHGLTTKSWWALQRRGVPTVYWVDFSQPEAFFVAQSVQLRDADIVYVANAGAVSLTKALSLFGLAAGRVQQADNIVN